MTVTWKSLGRGVDHGPVDRMKRALGKGRERAHLLDLVAVELDAERLAARGREDVEEAAADGELAALLSPLDPLVACKREVLREAFETGLAADGELERLGPGCGRWHSLGKRGRGRGDEASGSEHVQRTGALADEVGRRLEPGAPADAAAREQRNVLGADEPAGRLGEVARVGVLRQQHDEAVLEVLVQRRQQERQHRLGDTRARRQGSRERLQALEREQLPDERVEYRTVQTSGRNAGSGSRIVTSGQSAVAMPGAASSDTPVCEPRSWLPVSERNPEPMTKAQRDALAAELADLEGPRRAEVVEAIATARGYGDLSENFAYHDAKNEQGLLERRIAILRDRVENAVIVEQAADGVVGVGSVVEVEDESGGRFEVEISSVAGGVSSDSPLGAALIGAKVGDAVAVQAPKGPWTAKVISVRKG